MITVREAMAILGQYMVRWECDKCKTTMVAWLSAEASIERPSCSFNYRAGMKQYPLRKKAPDGTLVPYICGGKMVVILDERPSLIDGVQDRQ
jgi:hypothetical protein